MIHNSGKTENIQPFDSQKSGKEFVDFDQNMEHIGYVLVNNGKKLIFNDASSHNVYTWDFLSTKKPVRTPELDTLFLHTNGASASCDEKHVWVGGNSAKKVYMI